MQNHKDAVRWVCDDDSASRETIESKEGTEKTNSNSTSPYIGRVLYIQMELCQMTLEEAINQIKAELHQSIGESITPVGAFIASQFFFEIVKGVHYLNSLNPKIIHRDLKPRNIFLTDGKGGNFIKIGDFGLAVFHEEKEILVINPKQEQETEHTMGRGTKSYMAPEVINSTEYDELCDIYSLGCVLLDLLCTDNDHINTMAQ